MTTTVRSDVAPQVWSAKLIGMLDPGLFLGKALIVRNAIGSEFNVIGVALLVSLSVNHPNSPVIRAALGS
jgi:hypothetical protein